MKYIKVLTILVFSAFHGLSQNNPADKIKENNQLIDTISKTRYVLNSSRTTITAISKTGKVLWKTNPEKENKVKFNMSEPVIRYFYFDVSKRTGFEEQIMIVYIGRLSGTINKQTGKFKLIGQD